MVYIAAKIDNQIPPSTMKIEIDPSKIVTTTVTGDCFKQGSRPDLIEMMAAAMQQSFMDRIAAGISALEGKEISFAETKVSLPNIEIYRDYAKAALDAIITTREY